MKPAKWKVGDLVEKIHGARYPSVVIGAYTTLDGEWMYTIEASHPLFRGDCKLASGDELQRRSVHQVQVAA